MSLWYLSKYKTTLNVRQFPVIILESMSRGISYMKWENRRLNWIGHILRRNCLLQEVIEGKIKGQIEVTRRRGRRCKKLLDDLKDRRGYCQLKKEAVGRTMWRNRFGRGFGPVVWQITDDDDDESKIIRKTPVQQKFNSVHDHTATPSFSYHEFGKCCALIISKQYSNPQFFISWIWKMLCSHNQ